MFKPTETQRIHEKMLLTRKVTWERVFCNLGDLSNPEFHKGKPGKSHCSLADLEEFIEHSGKLIQHSDGYITYLLHTHENGDRAVHKLDIKFHDSGYQELKDKGVLY